MARSVENKSVRAKKSTKKTTEEREHEHREYVKSIAEAREKATALYAAAIKKADKILDDAESLLDDEDDKLDDDHEAVRRYHAAFDAADKAYARCAKSCWNPKVPFVIEQE